MLLPVEANEGTEESQEVLTPWSGRAVYLDDGHGNALQDVAFPTQDENGCQCQAYGCDVGETTGKTTYLATIMSLSTKASLHFFRPS